MQRGDGGGSAGAEGAVTAPLPASYNIYAGLGVGSADLRVVLLNSSRSPCILIAALVLCSGGFAAPSLRRSKY